MSSARPSSSVDKSNDDGGDYLGREIKEAVAGDQPVVEKKNPTLLVVYRPQSQSRSDVSGTNQNVADADLGEDAERRRDFDVR